MRTKRQIARFFNLLAACILAAAAQTNLPDVTFRREVPLGLDLYMPVPEANPLTPEKVTLGRRLFFDPILSRDYTVACATCHEPQRAFSDGRPRAIGVGARTTARHAPAILNRGYGRAFFWDGRAASLEQQALQPIENPDEFAHSVSAVVARLDGHSEYPASFKAAFGEPATAENLARALSSYVRTILSGDAPVDRYYAGDAGALSEEQKYGKGVFRGRGNCTACHVGPNFTDEQFHNTGIAFRDGTSRDEGRFAVTGKQEDRGRFKTPTLREVGRTAPYMHDGSLATLDEVVEFYDRGGHANPNLDPELRPLKLTVAEKRALLAFLQSLSGTIQEGKLRPR